MGTYEQNADQYEHRMAERLQELQWRGEDAGIDAALDEASIACQSFTEWMLQTMPFNKLTNSEQNGPLPEAFSGLAQLRFVL